MIKDLKVRETNKREKERWIWTLFMKKSQRSVVVVSNKVYYPAAAAGAAEKHVLSESKH